MHRLVLSALAGLLLTSAQASEPGQPVDVTDWVILDPSLQVQTWATRDRSCEDAGAQPQSMPPTCHLGFFFRWDATNSYDNVGSAVDAEGSQWVLTRENLFPGCPIAAAPFVWKLFKCGDPAACVEVAEILGSRCDASEGEFRPLGMWIDSVNGYLYVRAQTGLWGNQLSYAQEIHRFSGLTTMFEVMQTYAPTTSELGFRVPFMPEGFPAADYFDTYYGDLATVGDWSQAQPLQCGYPATPPSVGDYLTVADPLPDPAPGTGRYYVTAVTHQGQRRFGRKATNNVLSGRDPGALPGCGE